jgi:mono/diheme cytochrome c family protein
LAQSNEASPAAPDQARALYRELCQRCHAADGKGDPATKGVPDFTRRTWHEQKSNAQLIVSILNGKGAGMPAFRDRLDQEKAREFVGHIRAFAPAAPGEKRGARAGAGDFEAQMQRLQQELRELREQVEELSIRESSPEKHTGRVVETNGGETETGASARAARGLFRRHCQRCHGPDGKGIAGKLDSPDPPDFTRRAWQEERSDARLLKSILDGRKKGMPAFHEDLSEDQARDLMDYIRAFTPPRRANSTKPREGPGDGPCRRKQQERGPPTERLVAVLFWRGLEWRPSLW